MYIYIHAHIVGAVTTDTHTWCFVFEGSTAAMEDVPNLQSTDHSWAMNLLEPGLETFVLIVLFDIIALRKGA